MKQVSSGTLSPLFCPPPLQHYNLLRLIVDPEKYLLHPVGHAQNWRTERFVISTSLLNDLLSQLNIWRFALNNHPRFTILVENNQVISLRHTVYLNGFFNGDV